MFAPTYHSFGLDISDLSLKLVEIRHHVRSLKLAAWNVIDVPAGVIEHGYIKNMPAAVTAIRTLVSLAHGKISTRSVVSCLPETKSFIKLIHIPATLLSGATSRKALDTIVHEQLTHHIPIPLDEACVDWQFVSSPQPNRDAEVLVGAVPKTIASDYATLLRTAGLIPVALEIEAQSIVRALNPDTTSIIIDSGATRTSLILWSDGMIRFSTSHPLSGTELTKTISDKLKLTLDEAERTKRICGVDPKRCKGAIARILDTAIAGLADSVIEMSSFYLSHFPAATPIERIYLCGGNAHLARIDTQLAIKTGIPSMIANPLLHIDSRKKTIPQELRLSFATAIGLALRGLV